MKVRDATADDADQICRLLASGLGFEQPALSHVRSRLREGATGCVTLVAALERQVVGVATCVVLHPPEYAQPQARIIAIVVSEAQRNEGVGRQLVAAIEEKAKLAGCFRVELTSGHHLVGAHRFWKTLGYENAGLRFRRTLDHPQRRAAPA